MKEQAKTLEHYLGCDSTPRDRRNLVRYGIWMALWLIGLSGANRLIKLAQFSEPPVSWLIAAVPGVLFAMVIAAYVRYLRDTDEMQRFIHLRALGVGFAAVGFALFMVPLLEKVGLPAADTNTFVMVLAGSYSLALIQGSWALR